MATRGEKFRAQAERASSKKKPKRRPKSVPRQAARSNERARAALVERSNDPPARVPHNVALRVSRRDAYALETTGPRRPPRKSTRKSRLKPDSSLRIRATDRTVSPEARSGRRARRPRRIPRAEEE